MAFARDVTANISVPSSQATGGGTLGDIASVASLGMNLFQGIQANKQQAQAAAHEEGLFQAASELDTLKLNLRDQEVGSVKQNAKIQNSLSRWSAKDRASILKISSENTGRVVKETASAEFAERNRQEKELTDRNNSNARSMGFVNYDAMPENRDEIIESHMAEQFQLQANAAKDAITLRELDIASKTDANLDRKATIISDNAVSHLNIGIRNSVRSGFSDLQDQRRSGEITSDADLGKAYVELLNRGQSDLDQQFGLFIKGQTDPLVRNKLESKYQSMREEYSLWADMMTKTGSGIRQQQLVEQQLKNITTETKANIMAIDGISTIVGLIDLGIQDASTLNQLNLADKIIGDQAVVIGEALRLSLAEGGERTSPWSSFYKEPDTDNLKKSATAVTKVSKDLMSGKIEVEGGPEFALDNTAIYMEEVINGQPAPNQFIKEVVANFTDIVLDSNYDSMPEAQKKRIGDNAADFTRMFFGTNNTGSFVPSVNKMLQDSGLGGVLKSSSNNPLWSLGVNKDTGMLEVSLPSDKRILENLDASGSGRSATGGNMREIRKRLRKFKQDLETNPTIRKVLQATSKATGKDIELVTSVVLSDLSLASNIPVAEAFTLRPVEEKKKEETKVEEVKLPKLDFSGMTREEAEELMRLQLEETFGK